MKSPTLPTKTELTEESINNSNSTIPEQNTEEVSDVDTAKEEPVNPTEETEPSV